MSTATVSRQQNAKSSSNGTSSNGSSSGVKEVLKPDVPGMGAIPQEGGVFFRVWAPNAQRVFVTGEFNKWRKTKHPLHKEDGGTWAGLVQEAQVGQEYKYVIHGPSGSGSLLKNDPYARRLTNSAGNSIICVDDFDWGDAGEFAPAPLNDLVIYELHVGSFNAKEEGKPGTFDSVCEKLDYLVDLGINAIELMPVSEFPGGFSWGYNMAYPFAVESDYGGAEALKRLIKCAHEKGIAVFLDVVYNHFGPSDLDLWQFDGWSENEKGGIYFYNDWRSKTPWGDTRPDYGREEVRNYIRDNILMWLEEFRIDGLRWDATCYIAAQDGNSHDRDIPKGWELMQWLNGMMRERFPKKHFFAEDLKDDPAITEEIDKGGAGFNAQWDPRFVHPVRAALITMDDANRELTELTYSIEHQFNGKPFNRVVYTESHDETASGKQRLPQEINEDVGDWFAMKRSILGAVMVFTSPGIPMILQGQELLEDGWFRDDDPIEWDRLEKHAGVHQLYRDLIHLRLNADGNSGGLAAAYLKVLRVDHERKVLAYQRATSFESDDQTIIVLNLSNNEYGDYRIGFPRNGEWKLRLNTDAKVYSDSFEDKGISSVCADGDGMDGLPQSGALCLPRYTALIYTQDQ